jgi:hypothetical protein
MLPVFAPPAFRSRLRTTVATALVLVIIFVSISAVLLSSKSGYIGVSKKNQVPSPVPTRVHPTPGYVPGQLACPLDVNAGLHYVCTHKLYQTIAQEQVKGGFTIVLQAAYADENRISVSYQVLKKEKNGTPIQGLEGENSLHSGYVTLAEQSGTILKELGSSGIMNSKSGKMDIVEFFQAPVLLGSGSKQLNVRLHFDGVAEYTQKGTYPLVTSAPFDFDFPLYVDLAHESLAPYQTVMSNGIPMTLETVSITPTSIVLNFNFQQSNSMPAVIGLWAVGVKINDKFSGYANVGQTTVITYNGSLLDLKGPWTLKMQQRLNWSESGTPSSIDPTHVWNFQFTVK